MLFNGAAHIQGSFSSTMANMLKSLLRQSLVSNNQVITIRNYQTSRIRLNKTPKINATHRVNNLERRFLVWTGKYKRVEDVPQLVPPDVMERSRNIIRIRVANIMMVSTLLGCLLMVWSGKRARERGETLERQNYLWHKRIQEEEAAKREQSQ